MIVSIVSSWSHSTDGEREDPHPGMQTAPAQEKDVIDGTTFWEFWMAKQWVCYWSSVSNQNLGKGFFLKSDKRKGNKKIK